MMNIRQINIYGNVIKLGGGPFFFFFKETKTNKR